MAATVNAKPETMRYLAFLRSATAKAFFEGYGFSVLVITAFSAMCIVCIGDFPLPRRGSASVAGILFLTTRHHPDAHGRVTCGTCSVSLNFW
jgi:hypothetical protein